VSRGMYRSNMGNSELLVIKLVGESRTERVDLHLRDSIDQLSDFKPCMGKISPASGAEKHSPSRKESISSYLFEVPDPLLHIDVFLGSLQDPFPGLSGPDDTAANYLPIVSPWTGSTSLLGSGIKQRT
jgi:hypothetical protein